MTSWIEPPPKQRGMGCLGKGCLLIIIFLILLGFAFVIGFYYGTKPKQIPQVQTSEEEQKAVKARWDEFEGASRSEPVATTPTVAPPSPAPDVTPVAEEAPIPSPTPSNRIELTANDINQLIANSRRTRGKAYVSIDNDVAHVQVTIPLDKVGFRGRFLNGEFSVRPSPDHNPRNLQITQMTGIPDGVVNSLLGSHSIHSYIDDFANTHGINSFTIENNKVILETNSTGR
jgi:hypothetical protein